MTSKLTRERIELIANFHRAMTLPPSHAEIEELARMVLDAMDSEPVILYRQVNPANGMKTYWAELDLEEFRHLKQYADENAEFMTLYRHAQPAPASEPVFFIEVEGDDWINAGRIEGRDRPDLGLLPDGINYLYAAPQPAPARKREQVRREHAEWSQATFGDVGPIGPLKHLSKEALEAAAEPCDLSEWADMQFLLWDAQRRAGITDDQITQAMIEKLAVNKQREWPEPKDGEPRLHIKEQPAPVVPEEKPMPNPLSMYVVDAVAAIAEAKGWNACRAAMLQELLKSAGASNNCRSNENVQVVPGESRCSTKAAPTLDSSPKTAEARCSNSPVIPDGWQLVPVEPNGNMLAAAQDAYGETEGDIASTLRAAIAAAPQEVQEQQKNAGGEGE